MFTERIKMIHVFYVSLLILAGACLFTLTLLPPQQDAFGKASTHTLDGAANFKKLASIETTTTTTSTPIETTTTTTTMVKKVKPTAPPVTLPASPAPTGSWCDLVLNYDWPQATAMRICKAESGGNPNAANMNDYHSFAKCYGSFGLMQLNCGFGQILDPNENIRVAYGLWQKRGFHPWSTY